MNQAKKEIIKDLNFFSKYENLIVAIFKKGKPAEVYNVTSVCENGPAIQINIAEEGEEI